MKPCPRRLLYLSVVAFVAASFFEIPAPAKSPSPDAETNREGYRRAAYQALEAGKLSAAEDLFRQALKSLAKQAHKPDDTSACLNSLARTLTLEARSAEAEQLYKRSLAVLRSAYGSQSARLVPTMLDLGLDLGRKELGPNSTETAAILSNLAHICYLEGKLDEADTYISGQASTEGSFGQQDPAVAACLNDYAQVLRRLNRPDDASKLEARAGNIASLKD